MHYMVLANAPPLQEAGGMKALRIADAKAARRAVQQELRRSAESRYDHRLHGVLLVCQGHPCAAVAAWLGEHPATVQRWVHRFAARGCGGLREVPRPGRPGRLASADRAKAEQDLRASPRTLGYDQDRWDGQLLARHLRQHYGVRLGSRQCQRLLRRLELWPGPGQASL
jgi:transposase